MCWTFESGRGEGARLRQQVPVPLTEGFRTWYITTMGVSFLKIEKVRGKKQLVFER